MSLLPGQILPQSVPFGKVNEDGTVTIDQNWWLLIYNLVLKTLGTGGSSPIDDQAITADMNDATDDGNDVRPALADLERLTTLEEPQTTTNAADITELQALNASFAEDPIIARFTAQWDGLAPSSGGGTVNFLRADGTWALPAYPTVPVGANPTASVGLSVVNGSAPTFMRSDGAPALSQSIAPTWTGLHTFSPAAGTAITITSAASALSIQYSGTVYASTVSQCQIALNGTGADFGQIFAVGSTDTWALGYGVSNTTRGAAALTWDTTGAITVAGKFACNGVTPAAQPTGYGTPTGNALTASFAAGSITLANLAAEVAQLVIDLKKSGIIGA